MADDMVPAAARSGKSLRLSKDEVNALPLRQYEGPVHFVTREDQVGRVVAALRGERILGFDTETQPTFRSGEYHPPALLQLAASDEVFVFRLSTLPFGDGLTGLLASPDIIKVGVAPQRDINELKEIAAFEGAGIVDVAELARNAGIEAGGLRSLAAAVLGPEGLGLAFLGQEDRRLVGHPITLEIVLLSIKRERRGRGLHGILFHPAARRADRGRGRPGRHPGEESSSPTVVSHEERYSRFIRLKDWMG